MAHTDREAGNSKDRERYLRRAAARAAAELCLTCGREPPASGRKSCEPCLVRRREADRLRHRKAAASGLAYGGRDPNKKRRSSRAAGRKRRADRSATGRCTRCGRNPPVDGGATCEPCRISRRAAEKARYAARRAAGSCVRCSGPTTGGGSRCAPCSVLEAERLDPDRKNAAARRRYRSRRAESRCTDCNAPSQGAARCEKCARRSHARSGWFRGLPVYPPTFTVVLLGTDEPLGVFDDEMEVAAFLAFEKLDRDRVEVLADRSPMSVLTG